MYRLIIATVSRKNNPIIIAANGKKTAIINRLSAWKAAA
jgi:hypothetical protein